ncbi:ABC transporter [Clostridia bacterium]|nr:ABC transporter [Clostridia bacterium]
MNQIINVQNLIKHYGDVKAVCGISFSVEQGQLYSFLGTNGAGKSTTINALCTIGGFDSGEVSVGGFDLKRQPFEIKKIIGVVFQDSVLDQLLTVRENLELRAGLYYRKHSHVTSAVHQAVKATELEEIISRPYGKLSGGQRRRVDIARALLGQPQILFLDEPTTGLDPQTRKLIWQTVEHLRKETGMTVFLTTHYMEEAAQSDYITIISKGEIATQGTPPELKSRYASDVLRLKLFGEKTRNIRLEKTLDALPILERERGNIEHFEVIQGTMDDVFLNIAGGEVNGTH